MLLGSYHISLEGLEGGGQAGLGATGLLSVKVGCGSQN